MYVNSWLQLHPALIRVKLLLSSCLGSWEGNDGITNEKHAWIGWTYTNASITHRRGNSTISSRLKTYRKSSRDCNVSPTSSFRIALHAPCIQGHSKRTTLRQPRSNTWSWIHGSCLCQSCPSKRRSLGVKMRTEAAMSLGRVLQKLGQFLKNSKSKMLATEFHAEIKHFKDCELFGILQNPEQLLKLGNQALCTEANPAIRKNIGQCDLWTSATQDLSQSLPWNLASLQFWFNHLWMAGELSIVAFQVSQLKQKNKSSVVCNHVFICNYASVLRIGQHPSNLTVLWQSSRDQACVQTW